MMLKWMVLVLLGVFFPCLAQEVDRPVVSRRAASIQEALKEADRLEVVPVSFSEKKPLPHVIVGKEKIAELLNLFDFDDAESGFHCMCDGDHHITLFKGDAKIGKISHHHLRSLRWSDERWDGDALFQPGVSEAWCRWFKENGYETFETMRLEEIDRKKAELLEHENFMKPFPEAARKAYEQICSAAAEDENMAMTIFRSASGSDEKPAPQREHLHFLKACGDPSEAGLAICRALGSLAGTSSASWSSQSMREALVIGAFAAIPADLLPGILEKAAAENGAAVGAARLCFFEDAAVALPESRRLELVARLARTAVQKEDHRNVSIAIREAGRSWSPAVESVFVDIASGALMPASLPAKSDGEPGLRAAAILTLASKGNGSAGSYLEKAEAKLTGEPDRAALAIARAWLGDPHSIKPEHFKAESYTLGLSALACLEKQGGREALDLIIVSGFEHPWAYVKMEAVQVVQRMTGKIWFKGQENEREDHYLKDIREWWAGAKDSWVPPAKEK